MRIALLAIGVSIATGAVLVRTAARLRRYEIRHPSMAPALMPEDYVVAFHTTQVRRGDVIVFMHPTTSGLELVKRVVGLPNERVSLHAGSLSIDGVPIHDRWGMGDVRHGGDWQLADEVFVLGDHRTRSIDDSRTLGGIPVGQGLWKVQFRYWPPKRMGIITALPQRDDLAAAGLG